VGTLDDDLRLLAGSSGIDLGDSGALPPGIDLDLDGNPRVVGDAIDAGAFENQMPPDCSALNDCSSHGTCVADDVCQCELGFSGADCSFFTCGDLNHCSGHGRCIGPDQCQCDPGFVGLDCSVAAPIPVMSTWGIIILCLLVVVSATVVLRRRGRRPVIARGFAP